MKWSDGLDFPICLVGGEQKRKAGWQLTVETSWMWVVGVGAEVKPAGGQEA